MFGVQVHQFTGWALHLYCITLCVNSSRASSYAFDACCFHSQFQHQCCCQPVLLPATRPGLRSEISEMVCSRWYTTQAWPDAVCSVFLNLLKTLQTCVSRLSRSDSSLLSSCSWISSKSSSLSYPINWAWDCILSSSKALSKFRKSVLLGVIYYARATVLEQVTSLLQNQISESNLSRISS